ncbi:interleukin-36 receptor antagonist protein-like [Sphaerodactylus townsendi]|uniref:interleukin-36 receptor antagonist protein-like n=1 Tax=Sphaerodactylus townsendi TaxID=933632 RepID=UPI002026E7D8|nr:interleukin-36 receptor antagonist protein-like [Sphaerodactylus townsendi]
MLLVIFVFESLSCRSATARGVYFPHVPNMDNVHEAVSSVPEDVIDETGSAFTEKMKSITKQMGTNCSICSVDMQQFQLPEGKKNLSFSPWDVNPDLVELFSAFFQPDRLPLSMVVSRPGLFTLRDIHQKVVRKVHGLLVASPQTKKEFSAKISVVPNPNMDPSKFPIIMGIDNGTRCISSGMASRPVLKLENRRILDLYRNSNEAKRFTFTTSFKDNTQRFESVAFPGWYLSTCRHSNRPLQLTNRLGAEKITDFYFRKV